MPLPGFLTEALTVHRARLDSEPSPHTLVFPSKAGTPLRRSHFRRRVWVPALNRSGLPITLRFHDLRHTYTTWLVSDGLPVNVVQRVMGHQQASTTLNRYTHAPADYDERVRAALDASADFSLTSHPTEDAEDGDDPETAGAVPART